MPLAGGLSMIANRSVYKEAERVADGNSIEVV
mgnify:CR=1 FL=1